MNRVSIIIHQRRLSNLMGKLGETGLVQIIKKETDFTGATQLSEDIIKNIEDIQKLQEKLKEILDRPIKIEKIFLPEKVIFEGITIEDIIRGISSDLEQIYTKKEEFESHLNEINLEVVDKIKVQQLLNDLNSLNIDLTRIRELKNLVLVRIGYISTKNTDLFIKSLEKYPTLYFDKQINEENSIFLVASAQKYKDEIRSIENEYHTTMIENLDEIDLKDHQAKIDEIEKLKERKNELDEELLIFLEKQFNILNAYKEVLNNINNIIKTEINFSRTAHFVTIEGWIPVSKLNLFMTMCNETTENTALIFVSKKFDVEKPPPSKFKNSPIVRSFETLTRLYGYPNYKEIDPTIILTITFPFIFGLMFGDIGHGLLLFCGGFYFYYKRKNQPGSWKNIAIIIALCGIYSIIAGIFYGEFFGMHEIFGLPLHPILFNPIDSMMTAMKFSIYVGTAMLSLGFLIEAINYSLEKRRVDSLLVALPKMFIIIGGVYMVFNYGFNLNNWFQGPLFILIIPALLLVFGKMLLHTVSLSRILPSEKTASLLGSGLLEGWETILSFISNIPSFCRIFALSLVHIGLTSAVITLSEFAGNIVIGSIILVVGHIAVVLFEMMLVFVHSLRLHFYEFFGKFYKGSGSQFSPFYLQSQFSVLKFKVPSGME